MAEVRGESEALSSLVRYVNQTGLNFRTPEEIANFHKIKDQEFKRALQAFEEDFDKQSASMKQQILDCTNHIHKTLLLKTPESEAQLNSLLAKRDLAKREFEEAGPILSALVSFSKAKQLIKLFFSLSKCKMEYQSKRRYWDHYFKSLEMPLVGYNRDYENHIRRKEPLKQDLIKKQYRQSAVLDEVVTTGRLGGAQMEMRVIEELKNLPSKWVVLNDIRLESENWLLHDNTNLKTAQIDHIAIGPPGVFIIESKNWSKEFISTGNYFLPGQQAARALYLCSYILHLHGFNVKSRSIIATNSNFNDLPVMLHTKVLKPDQIIDHISGFPASLNSNEVEELGSFLWRRFGPR